MQLGPDTGTGTPDQQPYRLAAVAERQHEQSRSSVFAALRIAHHRTRSVIDLSFFSGDGLDNPYGLRLCGTTKLVNKTLHGLVAMGKTRSETRSCQMAMAFRPRRSPCSIHSRNGSQALATRRLPVGGEIGGLKSVVSSLAGFESAESVVTSLAGFAGARRPQAPGARTPIPAALR